MAYAQWVIILLKNRSQKSIKIKNVKIDWGKFHKDGDKDSEISSGTIEGKTIDPGKSYQINSCGRSDAASGTEGSFNLVDDSGHVIRNLYWDCPWGSKTNYWKITDPNEDWLVDSYGANLYGGALGTITAQVVYVGD